MYRAVRRLRLPQKKLIHAAERDTPRVQAERHACAVEAVEFDLRPLKFVDESGVNISMTRLYGRASRGAWDTGELPPGDYTLRIHASDFNGNEAETNRDLPVTIVR